MAGTVTTPSATTLEGQMLELAREFVQAEEAWIEAGRLLDPPENRQRRASVNNNPVTGTVTIQISLPTDFSDSADGFAVVAQEYIL